MLCGSDVLVRINLIFRVVIGFVLCVVLAGRIYVGFGFVLL